MAYEHVRFDLRRKHYRRKKDYYHAIREGRTPEPAYIKPHVCIVKLDPEQAILAQCMIDGGWLMEGDSLQCVAHNPAHAACDTGLRGGLAKGFNHPPGTDDVNPS